MYIALVFIAFLSYDVWLALWFTDPATGAREFGIGVGTMVLAVNVVLLALLHAGAATCCGTSSAGAWTRCRSRRCATCYMPASSRSTVGISCSRGCQPLQRDSADLYVRLCSMGVIWTDLRIL
jgi:hypothetical protein